jgi:ComF family protein
MSFLSDFFSLVYPEVCMACGKPLFRFENCICSYCLHHLPQTNFHLNSDNPVSRLFWGRVKFAYAASFLFYNKGGKVQQLIHQLKYKDQKQVGFFLGSKYGELLKKADGFSTVDTVIPVPLHPKKQRKRGYNQSDFIAEGISKSMDIKIDNTTLFRAYASDTQTKKSRFNRFQNVSSVFALKDNKKLQGHHILIVDDVITTGSTLESCISILQQTPDIKVSIATLAVAN